VRKSSAGFTLLEVLVASVIMAVAIAGLLSNLTTSMRNAARLTEYDRAALLARHKMDELLVTPAIPGQMVIEGRFDPVQSGTVEAAGRPGRQSLKARRMRGRASKSSERIRAADLVETGREAPDLSP
jgi:prepilin-type N-terminal cleavage/methylation domain-containing protein